MLILKRSNNNILPNVRCRLFVINPDGFKMHIIVACEDVDKFTEFFWKFLKSPRNVRATFITKHVAEKYLIQAGKYELVATLSKGSINKMVHVLIPSFHR